MSADARLGRLAGMLYLIVVITGMFSLVYVPSVTIVPGNASATIARIREFEPLFRLGIGAFLIKQVAFLLLPLVLYQLLHRVNRAAALLMLVLALVSAPLALLSIVNKMNVVSLLGQGIGSLPEQVQAGVMQSLLAYSSGITVTSLFWGLWLLPFGYLVYRSGFLPKILGVLLMLGCMGYVIDVFSIVLVPGYSATGAASLLLMPAAAGEIGTCLWLLVMGVRPRPAPPVDTAT